MRLLAILAILSWYLNSTEAKTHLKRFTPEIHYIITTSWAPSTWIQDFSTTTITSTVWTPCVVTVITTITKCYSCEDPPPPPPPVPCETGGLTCPLNVLYYITDQNGQQSPVTAPYDPDEAVTDIEGNIVSASDCCAFIDPEDDPPAPVPAPNPDPPASHAAAAGGVITTPYYSYTARGSVYTVWTTMTPNQAAMQLQGGAGGFGYHGEHGHWLFKTWFTLALVTGIGMLVL